MMFRISESMNIGELRKIFKIVEKDGLSRKQY